MEATTFVSRWAFFTGILVCLGLAACERQTSTQYQPGTTTVPAAATDNSAGRPGPKPTPPAKTSPADDEPDAGVDDPGDTLRPDGDSCRSDAQCDSGHCDNRICCSGGTCCDTVDDCEANDDGEGAQCTTPSECQGSRGPIACRGNRCIVSGGSKDDEACDDTVEADDCGLYAAVFCNGASDQDPPECATSCDDDSDCDATAHCTGDRCVTDFDTGETCATDSECESDSCSLGKCCADGDCCETVADCPDTYNAAATCDDPETCQGTHGEARCVSGRCESEKIADDAACGYWTPSKLCGQTRRLTCRGGADQQEPSCGTGTCYNDSQCDNSMHCSMGMCVTDIPNGEDCDRDALCASNHCNAGLCCDGGVCCRPGDACADSAECVTPTECQGERYQNECSDHQCRPVQTEDDDSVCWGRLIDSCGTFADMRCGADPDQDVSERECTQWCVTDWQCDPGLDCGGAFCYYNPPDNNNGNGNGGGGNGNGGGGN